MNFKLVQSILLLFSLHELVRRSAGRQLNERSIVAVQRLAPRVENVSVVEWCVAKFISATAHTQTFRQETLYTPALLP